MANVIVGSILAIGQLQNLTSKSGNAFKRRELTISVRRFDPNTGEPVIDNENTPQFVFMGDRCDDLNRFQPGQMVTISFDVQGRKYVGQDGIEKIITDIRPYKIEPYQPRTYSSPAQPSAPAPTPQPQVQAQPQTTNPMFHQAAKPQATAPGFGGQGYNPPF